jgi:hypothetical protein
VTSRVPAGLADTVRPNLQRAILQCLDPDPSRRPATPQAVAASLQTVLLDTAATWRRIVQVGQQLAVAPLLIVGVKLLAGPGGTLTFLGVLLIIAGVACVVVELRYPLGWKLTYKGHRIRFTNHPFFGERLYIDDALVDRGRIGVNVTLRGTIERGTGAGERITANRTGQVPEALVPHRRGVVRARRRRARPSLTVFSDFLSVGSRHRDSRSLSSGWADRGGR